MYNMTVFNAVQCETEASKNVAWKLVLDPFVFAKYFGKS